MEKIQKLGHKKKLEDYRDLQPWLSIRMFWDIYFKKRGWGEERETPGPI